MNCGFFALAAFDFVLILFFLWFLAVGFRSGDSKQDPPPAGYVLFGDQVIQPNDLGFSGTLFRSAWLAPDRFLFRCHDDELYHDACQDVKAARDRGGCSRQGDAHQTHREPLAA